MQVDRRIIETNLTQKGFVEEDSHHRYFYHELNGKRTGIYIYTSRGSKYKTYGKPLLLRMKKELRLSSVQQTIDLIKCPMDGDTYNSLLKEKGLLKAR